MTTALLLLALLSLPQQSAPQSVSQTSKPWFPTSAVCGICAPPKSLGPILGPDAKPLSTGRLVDMGLGGVTGLLRWAGRVRDLSPNPANLLALSFVGPNQGLSGAPRVLSC